MGRLSVFTADDGSESCGAQALSLIVRQEVAMRSGGTLGPGPVLRSHVILVTFPREQCMPL